MGQLIRHLAPYLAAAAVASALVAVALRLWHADLDVPLVNENDNWMNLAWTKGIAEHGWYLHNDRLGAPHEMDLRDFPMTDVWHFLCLKGLLLLGCSAPRAVNLYFLAGFPLAAVSSLWVLRRWSVSLLPAFVVAQLFVFMPFHFTPGQAHLFLSSYYLLPPMIALALGVWRHGGPQSRAGWIGSVVLCVFAGGSGVYYVFYLCFFLLVAAVACALRQRRARPLAAAAVLVAVLSASVAACASPTVVYQRQHLDNPLVGRRYALESMRYSLHFARLFVPVKKHYLEPFAEQRRRFDVDMQHYPTESNRLSLGVVGCTGLLYLLGRLLAPAVRSQRAEAPLTDDGLKLFTVTGLLLAMTSGGAVLFALIVSPTFRAHARMNAFLAFFALMAVGLLLSRLEQRCGPKARILLACCLVVLLLGGFLDQTGLGIIPDHQANAEQWRHDEQYFAQVEARLSPGDRVFCLPVLSFPEALAGGRMCSCYEQMRGYLHTRQTRWSYGAIRNRYAGAWHERLADVGPEGLLDVLALSDFSGVLIDRFGYPDEKEAELACLLGVEPLESPDGRLAFYPLAAWRERLHEELSPDEWRRAQREAATPVLATWHREASGDENGYRWIGCEACVVLHNPTDQPRRVTLTMPFERPRPARRSAELRIEGDGWEIAGKVPEEGWRFQRELELAPGENRVWIRGSGPELDRFLGPRRAIVRIAGFEVRTAGGPSEGPPRPAPPADRVTTSSR